MTWRHDGVIRDGGHRGLGTERGGKEQEAFFISMLISGDGSSLRRNEGCCLGCVCWTDNYINRRASPKIKPDCGTTGDVSKWKSNQSDMWFIPPPVFLPFILQASIS